MSKYLDHDTPLVETAIKEHDEPVERASSPNRKPPTDVTKVSPSNGDASEQRSSNRITDRYSYRAAIYTNLEENYV